MNKPENTSQNQSILPADPAVISDADLDQIAGGKKPYDAAAIHEAEVRAQTQRDIIQKMKEERDAEQRYKP